MNTSITEMNVNDEFAVAEYAGDVVPAESGLILPATSAVSKLNRELVRRDVFQLESFGERDLLDAAKMRQTLAIWAQDRTAKKSPAYGIARKILVDAWQEARLPDACFDRIRPIEYPWSESARDLFFAGKTKGNITLEHVKPASYLLKEILFPAAEDPECTDEVFLDLLIREHSRLSFTVVTDFEDKMINQAGFRDRHVESEDDWARYRLSGIDPSNFMALFEDERFDRGTMIKSWRGKLLVVPPVTLVY